jgi:hypothetical protein
LGDCLHSVAASQTGQQIFNSRGFLCCDSHRFVLVSGRSSARTS